MAGGTGERERKEGGKRREEEVGEWGSRRVGIKESGENREGKEIIGRMEE